MHVSSNGKPMGAGRSLTSGAGASFGSSTSREKFACMPTPEECAIVTAILHCRYRNDHKTQNVIDTRLRYADRQGTWLYAFGHGAQR